MLPGIHVYNPPPPPAPSGGKVWSFIGSTNANATAISGPASGVQVGDLAILFDSPSNSSSPTPPALVVPSGYTQIDTNSSNDSVINSARTTISYKILTSGDLTGGAMNSVNGQSGTGTSRKIMSVFRDTNGPISGITVNSLNSEGNVNTPSPQTITSGSAIANALDLASFRTAATVGFTRTGMTDMSGSSTTQLACYRIFNGGFADQAVSMIDGGAFNILQSFYLT